MTEIWTRERVMAKVGAAFAPPDRQTVRALLDGIKVVGTGASLERIQLAVLKISEGDLEKLRYWVGIAQRDWRDVVAAAESPGELLNVGPVAAATEDAVRASDRDQYVRWLLHTDTEKE